MMAATRNKHWQPEKLEDICAQITDGKHGDCQDETDSGFYFLSCKDVANGRLNYEGARQITEVDFHDTHRRTKFAPSDVLITNSGTIGRMAIAPDNELTWRTTFQKSVAILKPITSRVEPTFLYYALQSEVRRLIEFAGGTAQKNLLLRDLRAFEVNVPALPIQRRIAGILSTYDELIENNQRRIKILESMARALYREWFVHFRFPGHESVPRVPSPLGDIPQGWEVTTLGRLVEIRKGKTITKDTIRDGNVPVVAGGITPAYFHDVPNTRSPVITISASGANAGFVNLYYVDVWASDCSYIDLSATPHVFYYYLYLDHRRAAVTHLQRGSAQPHVYPKDLAQLEALGAPEEVLDTILSQVAPIFGLTMRLATKIDNLRRTRDLLLPRLLSGQIDVEAIAS